jgi:hypothetical protein
MGPGCHQPVPGQHPAAWGRSSPPARGGAARRGGSRGCRVDLPLRVRSSLIHVRADRAARSRPQALIGWVVRAVGRAKLPGGMVSVAEAREIAGRERRQAAFPDGTRIISMAAAARYHPPTRDNPPYRA